MDKETAAHHFETSKLKEIVMQSRDIIYYCRIKPKPQVLFVNGALEQYFGRGSVQLCYEHPEHIYRHLHPDFRDIIQKKWSGDFDYDKPIIQCWMDENGRERWFEELVTPVYENGELIAMHGILRNIDGWIQLKKDLEYRISHDALTGAFSRDCFERMMKRYDKEVDVPMAIILCDLDELKTVNDRFGHREGDRLIKEAAVILMSFQSEKVFVSRIGGDEFAILVIEMELSEVKKLVEKMDEAINGYNNRDWPMKMSYGYAYSHSSKGNMEQLFKEADRNMYDNKFGKKG